jgi:uncharacterized protein (TIGR02145 family)
MKILLRIIIHGIIVAFFLFHIPASGQRNTSQLIIFNPSDDAVIHQNNPDYNDGADLKLTVRNKYGGTDPYFWERDALVNFNISSIPPGSQVLSASLHMYYYYYWDNDPGGRTLTCHKITQEWNEETVTFNNQPTWVTQATSDAIVPDSPGSWMTWDVTTDVQDVVANQGSVNHGWKVMDEVPWGGAGIPITYFYTKEFGSLIPYLEVTFNYNPGSCPGIPTVTYDGQTYNTVLIGSQCWLKENLNVGTMINGNQNQSNNGTIEKYCYNNNTSNCDVYGGIYQWNEMMQYSTTPGVQGICPSGWHLPSNSEWCQMATYLDPTVSCVTGTWFGTDAGGKLKEAGTTHWLSPNTGATNSSGFTALPSGYVDNNYYSNLNTVTIFWTSENLTNGNAMSYGLNYTQAKISSAPNFWYHGFSARCVKDSCPSNSNVGIIIDVSANPVCQGIPVTFNATSQNSGNSPQYQWQVNGTNAGTNSSTFTYLPLNNDVVTCIVTSNAPCVTGNPATSNAITMTVLSAQAPSVTGTSLLCENSGYYYYITEPGKINYTWSLSQGGSIYWNGGDNLIQVEWNSTGAQWVEVNYTNPAGCSPFNPGHLDVTVNPLPDSAGTITGVASLCAGEKGISYSVAPVQKAQSYVWSLPAGAAVASGLGTNSITVDFDTNAASGIITVYGNNLCGNGDVSPDFYAQVYPIPPATVIIYDSIVLYSNAPEGNQWYLDGIPIPEATGQTWTPVQTGMYWDVATLNGCSSDTSNNIQITSLVYNVGTTSAGRHIMVYPVPNDGSFKVRFLASQDQHFTITIYNILGVVIQTIDELIVKNSIRTIDLRPIPEGIYNVAFRTGNDLIVRKIVVNR